MGVAIVHNDSTIIIDGLHDFYESVTNAYGQPAGNTRAAELDPSGVNAYDPDSKTIKVKFFMTQKSLVPVAPYIRSQFDWTLKFMHLR